MDPSHIVLAAGGSSALSALVQQICDPGDGILLATPYWSGLDIAVTVQSNAVIIPVDVPLASFDDASMTINWYEKALKSATIPIKTILVCNPTNPTGLCYTKEVLLALLDFCNRNSLHFVSDEVYALSVHSANTKFHSALSLHGHTKNVYVVYSLSKDFGCSGVRLVCNTVYPGLDVHRLKKNGTFADISAPGRSDHPAEQGHLSRHCTLHPQPGLLLYLTPCSSVPTESPLRSPIPCDQPTPLARNLRPRQGFLNYPLTPLYPSVCGGISMRTSD